MKNTLKTDKQNSPQVTKIKSINQKVYKAIEKFGEIILGENIEKIYKIYNTENNNFFEEYDLNGNKIKNIIVCHCHSS
jgi:predicted ribonuclease toxin of YeeF-YezG toxin-antitoxin module